MKTSFRALVFVALAHVLLQASAAHACDTAAEATSRSTCVAMKREGRPGMWFDAKTGLQLVAEHEAMPELQAALEKYEAIDAAHARETTALRDAAALRAQAIAELQAALAKAAKAARVARDDAAQARAALGAWHRSPIPWLAVGALAGALATGWLVTR